MERVETTRTTRGIALWEERGAEIEQIGTHTWSVPAAGRPYPYTVQLDLECCTCADYASRKSTCKHQVAATIAASKARRERQEWRTV